MPSRFILPVLLCFFAQFAHADIYAASQAISRSDYDSAAAEFKRLAEDGDVRAQAHLGYMYYVGEGVPQSYQDAVQWYRKAAAQGDQDAQYNLAVAYAFGEGIKQDYKEAALWYRRAAEQGHPISQYSLGVSYSYGEGVPQDSAEAAKWFRKSAEQGYVRAQVLLGSKYHVGDGVRQDYADAAKWYRLAADRGNAAAQYNLGAMFRSGKGVGQDYKQARRWYQMAADQGYAAAQNELASLGRPTAGAARSRITAPVQPAAPEKRAEPEALALEQQAEPEQEPEPLLTLDRSTLLDLEDEPPPVAEAAAGPETGDVRTAEAREDALEEEIPDTELATVDATTAGVPGGTPATEKKRGFFSGLFGAKKKVAAEAIAAADAIEEGVASASAALTEAADDVSAPEAIAIATTEEPQSKQLLAMESIEPSLPEDAAHIEASIAETSSEQAEKAPVPAQKKKPGLFSRLFSSKHKDSPPKQEMEAAETQLEEDQATLAATEPTVSDIETDEVITDANTGAISTQESLEEGPVFSEESQEEQKESTAAESEPAPAKEETTVAFALTEEEALPATVPIEEISDPEFIANTDDSSEAVSTEIATEEETQTLAAIVSETQEAPDVAEEESLEEAREEKPSTGFFSRLFGKSEEQTAEYAGDEPAGTTEEDYESEQALPEPVETYAPEIVEPSFIAEQDEYKRGLDALASHEYSDAFAVFSELAAQGDANSQFQLASLYYRGLGIEQAYDAALDWYQRAAKQGNADAQYRLGNMFLIGEGVEQSDIKAGYWYEKAAERGLAAAKYNLANLARVSKSSQAKSELLSGEAIVSEENKVIPAQEKKGLFKRLFSKDSESEKGDYDAAPTDSDADEEWRAEQMPDSQGKTATQTADRFEPARKQYELGLAYAFGEGAKQDHKLAFELFMQSAEQAYAPAQYKLGAAYAYGDGVEKDLQQAAEWYMRAARQGHAVAQRNLAAMYLDGKGIEQNRVQALAWYSLLADSGNVMDTRSRDELEKSLSWEEIQEAQKLKRDLINAAR